MCGHQMRAINQKCLTLSVDAFHVNHTILLPIEALVGLLLFVLPTMNHWFGFSVLSLGLCSTQQTEISIKRKLSQNVRYLIRPLFIYPLMPRTEHHLLTFTSDILIHRGMPTLGIRP